MRKCLLPGLAFLCLVALPAPARPAPDPGTATKPGLVLRVQPIDELLANARYLAGLVGQEEQARQFEGLIKSMAGPQGLDGLDTKRPLAFYGNVGPNGFDSTAVLMIPVADEKALLGLLERLEVKAEKGKDDLYSLKNENLPVPIYLRFAHKYAYVTFQDDTAIAKDKLIPPQQILPAGQDTAVVSLTTSLGAIPDNLKQMAIQQLEDQLAEEKKKKDPNETELEHKFKVQLLDTIGAQLTSVIRDGEDVNLSFNVDRKAGDLSLDVSMSAKPGSKLARTIAELGQGKSVVAGLIGADSTMNLVFHLALGDDLRKAMAPVIDEAIKKAVEEEKDPAKRALTAKLLKVIEPTLKAAEFDAAMDVRGPSANDLYTVVAGLKLKDGETVERALRDALKDLPPAERAKVKFDVDQAGKVKIHRLDVQKDLDEEFRKSFGDNPVYVAFRSDAAFVAAGEKGLMAIKDAINAPPKAAVAARVEISMARLAQAMASTQKGALKAAQEAFGKDGQADKFRATVEGGQVLRVRAQVKAPVIKFLAKVAELDK